MAKSSWRASGDDDLQDEQRRAASSAAPKEAPPILFPIALHVRYKLRRPNGAVEFHTGETISISRREVLFRAQAPPPQGGQIELSISWPVELDGECGLNLVVRGKVVRCDGTDVVLKVWKYEFRTAGRMQQSHGQL